MRISKKAIRRRAIILIVEIALKTIITTAAMLAPLYLAGLLVHLFSL